MHHVQPHNYAYTNSYADTDTDIYSHTHAHTDTDTYFHTLAHTYTYTYTHTTTRSRRSAMKMDGRRDHFTPQLFQFQEILKPNYNSVDLAEVEQPMESVRQPEPRANDSELLAVGALVY